jgi:hypothetical protein
MNMQAVKIRAIFVVAMFLGLSVVMLHRTSAQQSVAQSSPAITHSSVDGAAPVLLPTITVRPSAAEIAAAMKGEDTDNDQLTFINTSQSQTLYDAVSLPSLRLDMPYYSFGKVLPRVSKE